MSRRGVVSLLVGVAVVVSAAPGHAAPGVLYAAPGGTGTACTQAEQCSLSQALDLAQDGDRVVVAPGTHAPVSLEPPPEGAPAPEVVLPFMIEESITLEGPEGSLPTLLANGGLASTGLVIIEGADGARVENVRIQGGSPIVTNLASDVTLDGVAVTAGGVAIMNTGSLTLAGSSVTNSSGSLGGESAGVIINPTRELTITDGSLVADNRGGRAIFNHGGLTIDDGSAVRDNGGGIGGHGSVSLDEATVTGNEADGRFSFGGVAGGAVTIRDSQITGNSGGVSGTTTTVEDSQITGNAGGVGGQAAVTVERSTIANNTTDGELAVLGGVWGQGDTVIRDSQITGNSGGVSGTTTTVEDSQITGNAGGVGGQAAVTVERSTIANNTATGPLAVGGAQSQGPVTVVDSAIVGNTATGHIAVGGVWSWDRAVIRRSTIAGNDAHSNSGGSGFAAGGLALVQADGVVEQSTIVGNSADGDTAFPPADGVLAAQGDVTFAATIVAGATGPNCFGVIEDAGYNIDEDGSCGFSAANHSFSGNAPFGGSTYGEALESYLGELGDHGGPTPTVPLRHSPSPATTDLSPVGAAVPLEFELPESGVAACSTPDQRGVTALEGAHCSIGAFQLQPPDTVIDGGPEDGAVTSDTSPTFTYSGTPVGAADGFECSLDGAEFTGCPPAGQGYSDLEDGEHTFAVRAHDAGGITDPSAARRAWVIDSTPPDTTIDSGVADGARTSATDAGFTYTGAPADDTDRFECSLDGAQFTDCPAVGESYTGLGEGEHTFAVRAVDAAGNADPSPAERAWTVDSIPPDTTIDSGPDEGSTSTDTAVTFTYSGSPSNDTDGYECSLDDAEFTDCPSEGDTYTDLEDGEHTFAVRAIDATGNTDPSPAERAWTVDSTPPDTTIDTGPADGSATSDTDAAFTYTGTPTEDTAGFECSLDGDDYIDCVAAGHAYGSLGEGGHTFAVRALDAAGNVDPSPATRAWTVDATPPDTVIDSGPEEGSTTTETAATFTYSGDPAADADGFECSLDGTEFTACPATGRRSTGLGVGEHTFAVRAVDAAANRDASPAQRTWTIVAPPPAPVGGASAPPPPPLLAPAKLQVDRAVIYRADRTLDVLAPITARASGLLDVQLHADGRVEDLGDTPVDAVNRRVQFLKPIDAGQAARGTGIVLLIYHGDEDTQPQYVRLRAAANPADLKAGRPTMEDGRLKATGTLTAKAEGVVRIQLLFTPATGATRTLQYKAPITDGRYTLDQPLPQEVLAGIATRRGPLHSYTLYTGYYPHRIRGEMDSAEVLAAR